MHLLANLDLGGARSAAVNPMNLPGDSYHRDTHEPATETFERLRKEKAWSSGSATLA
jgi:hypothetical protein